MALRKLGGPCVGAVAMLLLIASTLGLLMAIAIVVRVRDRAVRPWLAMLCLATSVVCAGLWVETRYEQWALGAARLNMTAGLMVATAYVMSVLTMIRAAVPRWIAATLAVALLGHILTVWVTDAYFTGEIHRYAWGIYVAADPRFVLNPLLALVIGLAGLVLLMRRWRSARPAEKNQASFLFLAYLLLALCGLDYVPHFGVDLAGGTVTAVAVPLFLATLGYATIASSLLEFREFVGRATGWIVAVAAVATAYALVFEVATNRLGVASDAAHVGAAAAAIAVFAFVDRSLRRWAEQVLASGGDDPLRLVRAHGRYIVSALDERLVLARVRALCETAFGAKSVDLVESGVMPTVETAWDRGRSGAAPRVDGDDLGGYELVFPLRLRGGVVGGLAVGAREDGRVYASRDAAALQELSELVSIALSAASAVRRAPAEAPSTSGPLPDRYEAREVLGRGGMSTVYRAYDRVAGREVAVKIMDPSRLETPAAKERFLREARVCVSVRHPSIVQVHGIDVRAGLLVMEHVAGDDLAELLKHGPAPRGLVRKVASEILEALDAAHGAGVIHRDVKPANIVLRPGGRAVLVDFGVAHLTDHTFTRTGLAIGTPGYMAPEQARGEPVDERADLYALGATLYQLATGTRFVPGGGAPRDTFAHLARTCRDRALSRLIERCLAADPGQRPSSAGEALAVLGRGGRRRGFVAGLGGVLRSARAVPRPEIPAATVPATRTCTAPPTEPARPRLLAGGT